MNLRRSLLLGFLVANLLAVIFGWWQISGQHTHSPALWYIAIGRLSGLVASITVLIEILTMSRTPIVENNFDMEELTWFHKINGYLMIGSLTAHILFLLAGYALLDKISWWHEFGQFNSGFSDVLNATIGSGIFVAAVFASIKIARNKLPYQWWYAAHLTLYLAIVLTFPHIINSGGDFIGHPLFSFYMWAIYGVSLGLLGIYRFLRPFYYMYKYDFRVLSFNAEANRIHSVVIGGKNISNFSFRPGQFAVWWFLIPGLWWEGHPFSFSIAPNGKNLRLTFKESGDYTSRLASGLKVGARVLVDGPRGMFTSQRANSEEVLMIAGGIGVTPMRAMVTRLLDQGKKVTLIYAAKRAGDIAFSAELKTLSKQQSLKVDYYIEDKTGRLESETLAAYLQPDPVRKTVYICGPPAMMDSLRQDLEQIGVPKQNILSERFSF